MQIILSQQAVKEIIREFVANKFNAKIIDIPCFEPYTFDVEPKKESASK